MTPKTRRRAALAALAAAALAVMATGASDTYVTGTFGLAWRQ